MKQTRRMPFDLEKVKTGAKVVTRNGLSARIVDYKVNDKDYPVLGLIAIEGKENPYKFTINGKFYINKDYALDLFIEEEVEEKTRREYSGTDSIYVPKDDEGIREELIDAINGLWDNDALPMPLSIKRKDAWLAWLEKQDEQKTSNSLEISPNKWYICIEMCHSKDIIDFAEGHYYLGSDILKNCLLERDKDYMDFFRPWDINDAKDGDVLASKDGYIILIFKNIKSSSGSGFSSYCNYNNFSHYSDFKEGSWNRDCFIPATKKQRKQLFQKMKEEGYEWNADKKELKKIKEVNERRMTNQELAWWLRDCPEEHREWRFDTCSSVYSEIDYSEEKEHNPVPNNIVIRKNGEEWKEPLVEE